MALFKVGDRVRFADKDWVGVVQECRSSSTPPYHAVYEVSWTGRTSDGAHFNNQVASVEELEISPYDGWDVPGSREPGEVERWLAS